MAEVVVRPDGDDDGILHVRRGDCWRSFQMDKVFGQSSTQEQVELVHARTVSLSIVHMYGVV